MRGSSANKIAVITRKPCSSSLTGPELIGSPTVNGGVGSALRTRAVIGIDPGARGGVAVIDVEANLPVLAVPLTGTDADIATFIRCTAETYECTAFIEQPSAVPNAMHAPKLPKKFMVGIVKSHAKLTENFGMLWGMLVSFAVPRERVTPNTWQKALKCQTGGDKKITKQKAEELFPATRVTHLVADALLIAEYGRRQALSGGSAR
jgi:Holliday junction resolvasome RuvABC endonuclease subunit